MNDRVRAGVERQSFVALFLLSAIPNPRFDAAGVAAGSLGYSLVRYWVAVVLGKTIIYPAIASPGGALAPWLR